MHPHAIQIFIKAPTNAFTEFLPNVFDSYIVLRTNRSITVEQDRVELKAIESMNAGTVGDGSYHGKIIELFDGRRLQRISEEPPEAPPPKPPPTVPELDDPTALFAPEHTRSADDPSRFDEPVRQTIIEDDIVVDGIIELFVITNIWTNPISIFVASQEIDTNLLFGIEGYITLKPWQAVTVEQYRVELGQLDVLSSESLISFIETEDLLSDLSVIDTPELSGPQGPDVTTLFAPEFERQPGDPDRFDEPERITIIEEEDKENVPIIIATNVCPKNISIFVSEQTNPNSDLLPDVDGYVGLKPGSTIEVEQERVNLGQIEMLRQQGFLRVIETIRKILP